MRLKYDLCPARVSRHRRVIGPALDRIYYVDGAIGIQPGRPPSHCPRPGPGARPARPGTPFRFGIMHIENTSGRIDLRAEIIMFSAYTLS